MIDFPVAFATGSPGALCDEYELGGFTVARKIVEIARGETAQHVL